MVPVLLRGHHFLCILTFKSAGYTPAFVANMSAKVQSISAGAAVRLVEGPDDICNGFTEACRAVCDHDCKARETAAMDRLAIVAVECEIGRDLTVDAPLSAEDIGLLRVAFRQKTIRAACTDCSWKAFCDAIADSGFAGTQL